MPVDYDRVAATYHRRYAINALPGVSAGLAGLIQELTPRAVLEVGCGTGRWLEEFRPAAGRIYGLDLSAGMLAQASRQQERPGLVMGRAEQLPLAQASVELIFCVNAFHHFARPQAFIAEAGRLLRPGGALALVNMDPHSGRDRWYLYDYFAGVYETDLARFHSVGTILDWLTAAGFARATWQPVEHITARLEGRAVLADHFLRKESCSQLSLLSDAAYTAGLKRLETALARAETRGDSLTFATDLWLDMLVAWVEPGG